MLIHKSKPIIGENINNTYYKSGSTADFTDIIESLGRKVNEFNANNFKAVISGYRAGFSWISGNAAGSPAGTITSVGVGYSAGRVSIALNQNRVQSTSTDNHGTLTAEITVVGYLFDPSDKPFSI